jgi:hypothetical protein
VGNNRDTRLDPRRWCHPSSDNNVATPISAATESVAPNTIPARAHLLDYPAMTARKSAAPRKPTASKRSSVQAKPDGKAQGGSDPIILTESEDASAPSRSKQSQRKSAVPQLKPANGSAKGKGKAQGHQREDPIDIEPLNGVSDISDVEMSIPAPRSRSSPNGPSPVPAKEETLQRKLLQVGPRSCASCAITVA